ncbi:uncharacterized protein LY79DRAFT_550292 [Colletotrichum navitas]|uniref:Uncharacterized protein n=1 Tax=Colletotrichum navitas TaxID=681940 RepID=A0AAD8V5Z8_9PEZI|nr:uncharacterized protein LY79DRAFT_550292 [Colletotrichum navitas]KAK1594259.1 hypothetical protein LY79DRAFT_550292 [Colletotrichum navitas]
MAYRDHRRVEEVSNPFPAHSRPSLLVSNVRTHMGWPRGRGAATPISKPNVEALLKPLSSRSSFPIWEHFRRNKNSPRQYDGGDTCRGVPRCFGPGREKIPKKTKSVYRSSRVIRYNMMPRVPQLPRDPDQDARESTAAPRSSRRLLQPGFEVPPCHAGR